MMKCTLQEIVHALKTVKKLNDELGTQDFVEEQFTMTTNGSCLWIEFSGDRVFDSHDEDDGFNIHEDLEKVVREEAQKEADYRVNSLKNVKL